MPVTRELDKKALPNTFGNRIIEWRIFLYTVVTRPTE